MLTPLLRRAWLFCPVVIMLLAAPGEAGAATCDSLTSGKWSNSSSWSCGHVPLVTDDVTIHAGHTITMDGKKGFALSLTIHGSAHWTRSRTTDVGAGGINIAAGGDITGSANGVLTSAGGLNINAALSSDSVTVVLQTAAGQTIQGSGTLARLQVDTSVANNGSLTVSASLSGSGSLTNTATLQIGGSATIAVLDAGMVGNTVIYSGNQAQAIKAATADSYHHLILSGSGAKTAPSLLIMTGNLSNNGTFVPPSDGTVSFAGSAAQSITGDTLFYHLTFANSGGAGMVDAGSFVHHVQGDFSDNGSFEAGTSEIIFSGSAVQSLSGDAAETAFHKLTMNNSDGLLLLHDAAVEALLDCSIGIIETGDNRVNISTIGSISNAGVDSYVNGKLEKHFAAASPFTFTIGDAAAYTPVEVDFSSMQAAGSLTASTTAGDHPAITISDIDEEKSVNRYWALSSGDITGVYDIVLHFSASDVDSGANSDNFVIRRLDEQTEIWNHVTLLAANPTSTAGGGISAVAPVPPAVVASGFGFFAIGESSIAHFIRERELIYTQELYD